MIATHTLADLLGWPLFNFIWQGALIASICAIVLALGRNARPQLRYIAACTALLLCLIVPAFGVLQQWQTPQSISLEAAIQMAGQTAMPVDLVWIRQSPLATQIEACLPLLVKFWSLGVIVMMLRLGLGLWWVHRLAQHGQEHAALRLQWQMRTNQMAGQFDIGRKVQLQFHEHLLSPVTFGCLKPVIVMPASLLTGMPADMIEALLAHELAHIKRWDYVVNLMQNLVLSLLFYHPAVWWISKRIDAERELIADDLAIGLLGQARPLARALQVLDQLQLKTVTPALAAHGGDLLSRIKRLIRPDAQPWHWKMAAPVFAIAISLILLVQTQVIAKPEAEAMSTSALKPAEPGTTRLANGSQQATRLTAYVKTSSEHVLVMDEQSGKVLMEKNSAAIVPIASLSKLMTAMVTLDAGLDKDELITISKDDVVGGQNNQIKLPVGTQLSRQNLLELMLIPSSNAAAHALGRTYPGGQAAFVAALKAKINKLDLRQTNLVEAAGLSSENRSSAHDLAYIVKVAAKYPELSRLSSRSDIVVNIDGDSRQYYSTNALTANKDWGISLSKTGYSKAAGRCLSMRTSIAGKPVIMVLLNAKNADIRNTDAMQIRAALAAMPPG